MSENFAELTDEKRAELDAWADTQGAPRVAYAVYDDTGTTDGDLLGMERVGKLHSTKDLAVAWAEGERFKSWSVYRETRCVTRDREIWYRQAGSPASSSW